MDDEPATFSNGLNPVEDNDLDDAMIAVSGVIARVEALGKHRSYSLAITKLEEARHWLRDRKHKPA